MFACVYVKGMGVTQVKSANQTSTQTSSIQEKEMLEKIHVKASCSKVANPGLKLCAKGTPQVREIRAQISCLPM